MNKNVSYFSFLQTDFYLLCDEWEESLHKGGWKPEAVVKKLPDFLRFVKRVQSLVVCEMKQTGPSPTSKQNHLLKRRYWQVKIKPEKGEVMRISYKQDKSNHQYYLSNAMLKCVDSYKDLGVIMSRDLSWSNYVVASVDKANKVLGLLKRTVGKKTEKSSQYFIDHL